jgi:protein-S-isoprenylcysteine O-methyltransferase Ste14
MTKFLVPMFVWLGGALFVIALGFTAWSYFIVFARDAPHGGWPAAIADALLFSLFALHHSVFARTPVKSAVARLVGESLVRSIYVWIASVLLVLVCALWRPVGGQLYMLEWPWAGMIVLVQVAGLWLTFEGARAIDPLDLAGIRENVRTPELQVRGPYRLVRHPLYLGWMLMVFGAASMTGDRLVFAIVSTIYCVVAIPFEERSLTRLFGDRYERYRDRVRWRMLPYLY